LRSQTNGAITRVNQSSCSPEEGSKEGSKKEERKFSLGPLVTSRNELKVAKLEIDSLYICGNIPSNIGAIMKVQPTEGWQKSTDIFFSNWKITTSDSGAGVDKIRLR